MGAWGWGAWPWYVRGRAGKGVGPDAKWRCQMPKASSAAVPACSVSLLLVVTCYQDTCPSPPHTPVACTTLQDKAAADETSRSVRVTLVCGELTQMQGQQGKLGCMAAALLQPFGKLRLKCRLPHDVPTNEITNRMPQPRPRPSHRPRPHPYTDLLPHAFRQTNCLLPYTSLPYSLGRVGMSQLMRGLARLEAELKAALLATGEAVPYIKVRQ